MDGSHKEVFNSEDTQDDRDSAGPFSTEPGACDHGDVEKQKSSDRNNALQKELQTQSDCYKCNCKTIAEHRGRRPDCVLKHIHAVSFLEVTSNRPQPLR